MYSSWAIMKPRLGNKAIAILTYLLTYLLTPCSRVLLEKLTGSAANKEIPHILWNSQAPATYSLSWTNSIQFPQLLPTSWRLSRCLIHSKWLRYRFLPLISKLCMYAVFFNILISVAPDYGFLSQKMWSILSNKCFVSIKLWVMYFLFTCL